MRVRIIVGSFSTLNAFFGPRGQVYLLRELKVVVDLASHASVVVHFKSV